MVLELVAFCAWQWIDKVTLIDPWLLGETDPNSGCNIPVVLVLRRPQLDKCKSSSPRGLKTPLSCKQVSQTICMVTIDIC